MGGAALPCPCAGVGSRVAKGAGTTFPAPCSTGWARGPLTPHSAPSGKPHPWATCAGPAWAVRDGQGGGAGRVLVQAGRARPLCCGSAGRQRAVGAVPPVPAAHGSAQSPSPSPWLRYHNSNDRELKPLSAQNQFSLGKLIPRLKSIPWAAAPWALCRSSSGDAPAVEGCDTGVRVAVPRVAHSSLLQPESQRLTGECERTIPCPGLARAPISIPVPMIHMLRCSGCPRGCGCCRALPTRAT